jgi:hypothetical protein
MMNGISGLNRNDVIRAVALVSVMAFPLIAYAQLGSAAKPAKLSPDPAAAAAGSVTPAKMTHVDSCANQHWPFFSAECLRGSTRTIKPRLVSMNVEDKSDPTPAPKVAATDPSRRAVRLSDNAASNAPAVKARKPVKPRVAHARERRPLNLSYAANAAVAPVSMPGW